MSLNPRMPLCWPCGLEMRPEKNGVTVIEMAHFGPAALWHADLWKCPECGAAVVSGLAKNPVAEHYQPDFARQLSEARALGWSREVWLNPTKKSRGVVADMEAADGTP